MGQGPWKGHPMTMRSKRDSFLSEWTRIIKTMWPDRCPRCGLTRYEASGMDCCNFARAGDSSADPSRRQVPVLIGNDAADRPK